MGEFGEFSGFESGFDGFAKTGAEQVFGGGQLGFAAAIMAALGDEGAKSLPAKNNSCTFQFLIGALDGDDANQQILRELAKGGQDAAGFEPALADFAFDAVNDLLVERAICRRRNRPN